MGSDHEVLGEMPRQARPRRWALWLLLLIVVAAAASGSILSDVEQAAYRVVQQDGDFELRDYAPMQVAEVTVSGAREPAINQGFKQIAAYIFGENAAQQKLAMTAPVTQQSTGAQRWRVRFVMPAAIAASALPVPRDASVMLQPVPAQRLAAVRFSGIADAQALAQQEQRLRQWLQAQHIVPEGDPVIAFYNPPWTLPFLRRNEIMLEIAASAPRPATASPENAVTPRGLYSE